MNGLVDYLDMEQVPGTPVAAEVTIGDQGEVINAETSASEVPLPNDGPEVEPNEDVELGACGGKATGKPAEYTSKSGRRYARKVKALRIR